MAFKFYFRKHAYTFIFRWLAFLFCLFFIILFCFLGRWQWHRYHYKKKLLATYHQRLSGKPQDFLTLITTRHKNDLEFQKVFVRGMYVNTPFMLLQNQFYRDQLGYEVFTSFTVHNGDNKFLLVDRGWIPRNYLTSPPPPQDTQIQGYLKSENEHQFILGKNILDLSANPLILQKIDLQEISQITHRFYYPYVLRLDPSEPYGFTRHWTITTMPPQRHLGYSIQWFAMALALFIAYFCYSIRRIK